MIAVDKNSQATKNEKFLPNLRKRNHIQVILVEIIVDIQYFSIGFCPKGNQIADTFISNIKKFFLIALCDDNKMKYSTNKQCEIYECIFYIF